MAVDRHTERIEGRGESWVVIHVPTNNVVGEYDSREEAEESVKWYEATFGEAKLAVARV